ncbi:hypothetical protein [Neisseria wadsworthii]|uniref:hypothetical protein n=1 Tax=Neisseria wadsworthii TaxID=607711 RepID=UPI000D310208|nr:hypothetical protein [Neisseria wadsworthii]
MNPKHKTSGFTEKLGIFDTTLSSAEWLSKILTFLIIGGTGTTGTFLAKLSPLLKDLGPLYWFAIGIFTALIAAIILFLYKNANLKQSETNLNISLSQPKNTINPLSLSFQDVIIPIEDLRIPRISMHKHKHFKRCKFIGPGALVILGGSYMHNTFVECGDILPIPHGTLVTGITVLSNCTVEECEFIFVTLLTDLRTAEDFQTTPGIKIAKVGLKS